MSTWGIFLSSPRSWGCFYNELATIVRKTVFPTLVGVFPKAETHVIARKRLPHARGGVSSGWRQAHLS